jgi:hypothetical protein
MFNSFFCCDLRYRLSETSNHWRFPRRSILRIRLDFHDQDKPVCPTKGREAKLNKLGDVLRVMEQRVGFTALANEVDDTSTSGPREMALKAQKTGRERLGRCRISPVAGDARCRVISLPTNRVLNGFLRGKTA